MAARTVSEVANWDGRLDHQRQNSKWRRSSSTLARDPHHTPLGNQPFEIIQPHGRFSDQRRVEQSVSRSNHEVRIFSACPFLSLTHFKQRAQQRHSLANSPENARLPGRVDTTSTSSHDIHHYDRPSISVSLRLSTCLFFFTIHAAWRSKSTIITIPFCCIVEIIPLHP